VPCARKKYKNAAQLTLRSESLVMIHVPRRLSATAGVVADAATLPPQPTGTIAGFGLIYDTEARHHGLQDLNYAKTVDRSADGQLTWPAAMAWVSSLNYRGIAGWRLRPL